VVAIAATAGFAIWHSRAAALHDHQQTLNTMGVVLTEQTSRYVQVIELMMDEVQSRITALNITTSANFQSQLGTQEVQSYLAERVTNIPQADGILLIDANGLTVNWSRSWPIVPVSAAGRDYYSHFKDNNDPSMFIGSLSKGRSTGNLSLFFGRRVNGRNGMFLGLVVGVVNVNYLIDFYQTAGQHLKESVTLLRHDGSMLVRYPNPESAIGVKLPESSPWYGRVAEGGGSYVTSGVVDGIRSLVSVHPLRDYPLVVDVLMEEADVFAEWNRQTVSIASFALAAALTFTGLFWMLVRQFRLQAEQNMKLDAVLSNITQGVCFFDGQKRLLLCNRRYGEIYNLPPEATHTGQSLEAIMNSRYTAGSTPDLSVSDYLIWQDQLAAVKQSSSAVVALRNGRYVAISYQPMPGGGWVATHDDVTMQQQAAASIAFMARHDALTKLPNRVLFQERMEQAISAAGRGAEFGVICIDLDNFKLVNDTYGHPVGDGLLVAVADRLQACVRDGDTVARLGGDEFAIIQLSIRQPNDAEVLASRIIAAFSQYFEVDGHQIVTGVSIGITTAAGENVCCETLMRDGDIALYLAKTEGRGTVRFFEPEMDARIHLRRALELDLRSAVARSEFELHYQPMVSLITNKIIGFEALLRWHHPVRGLVSPLDFIPIAEETGLIVPIGEWVLRVACFEAENWPADIGVSVNLSPVQFKHGSLVAAVQAALGASGLRSDRLELEITESILLHDTEATLASLRQLRAMGISVALDDFGTGYSSLSYLHSFPFGKIKIDQSFVRNLMTNRESTSIIRAVVGLGQSLEIKTIAEGVETMGQLDSLRALGCTEAQGFLFGRPTPASELPLLIHRLQQIDSGAPAPDSGDCCLGATAGDKQRENRG
jgi:diguanylate cyclase (GGDEF)-like protein